MAGIDLQKFCDELRAKVSIVDVVGSKVKLVRKGREYQACCPFHNEKTPSFTVNEAKGFYHCFGCGAHGDIIKFEMEANNLPFMDAIRKLADKAGLQVPQISKESHEEAVKRNSLYDIMDMACRFFEKSLHLPDGQRAMDYLHRRGFEEDIITKFRLGYAPGNNGLKALLASKGISEHDMAELGLIAIPEDKNRRPHDFFRDRVMIPIMDKAGRVIAFGGRIMGDGQPKYLNSPETPLFNKRRVLYNLNNARDRAFAARNIIVCEGYMDVIALDKYGFGYAVAPLGTALTEDQIAEAWKVCPEPTLCFDGDGAGIRAAIRSIDRGLPILKAGYSLKYVFLPDKMDPDEFLKAHGHDAFLKYLQETTPLVKLLWRKNTEGRVFDTPEQKALIEKNVMEEVAKIADEKVRGYYQQEMQNYIYNELGRGFWKNKQRQSAGGDTAYQAPRGSFRRNETAVKQAVPAAQRPKVTMDELVVKFVLAAMVYYPELIAEYEERMGMFEISNPRLQQLFDVLVEVYHDDEEIQSDGLCKLLQEKGLEKDLAALWELEMFRQQNPYINKIREEIDTKIIEVQIKQLDNEIKECLRIIQVSESFPEEAYQRYESLKKEKESLLNTQNAF